MKIDQTNLDFIREQLLTPFGFKGSYLTELWQTVVMLQSGEHRAYAPAVQSVLWADADVFASAPPAVTNAMMLAVSAKALALLERITYSTPAEAIAALTPILDDYAYDVCGFSVESTFVQNALVGVDLALWSLYARKINAKTFDDIIPQYATNALGVKNSHLVKIPLISYNVKESEIKAILESGAALLKIKIGAFTGETERETDMRLMLEAEIGRASCRERV